MTLLRGIAALWFAFAMAALWRLALLYMGVSEGAAMAFAALAFVIAGVGAVAVFKLLAQAAARRPAESR